MSCLTVFDPWNLRPLLKPVADRNAECAGLNYGGGQRRPVPIDVSVTGFDNIKWSDVVTPRLTTIAQPVGAIGAKAVELLRERMSIAELVHRRTVFDVTLIERDSVRKL